MDSTDQVADLTDMHVLVNDDITDRYPSLKNFRHTQFFPRLGQSR